MALLTGFGRPAEVAARYRAGLHRPVMLAVIAAMLVLAIAVLIRGRWETTTRRAQVVLNIVTAGVLLWVLVGGDVFREPGADQLVKTAIGITLLAMLVGLALRLRRYRLATPAAPTAS